MFEDMRQVGAAFQTLIKPAAHSFAAAMFDQGRQGGLEALIETGDFGGGSVAEVLQVHPCFQDRETGPHIGAAKGENALKFHGSCDSPIPFCRAVGVRVSSPRRLPSVSHGIMRLSIPLKLEAMFPRWRETASGWRQIEKT